MDALLKKLNFKAQTPVLVIALPEDLTPIATYLETKTEIIQDPAQIEKITFGLFFVKEQATIDQIIATIAPKIEGDPTLWFAYPKGTSKKYTCNFNRDTGWAILGTHELEAVRQIAIDEDWSAIRFRKVAFIKKMTRSQKLALSDTGKEKTTTKN